MSPGAGAPLYPRLTTELAFRAHFTRNARYFRRKGPELFDHSVYGSCRAQKLSFERSALDLSRHGFGQVTFRYRPDDACHFTRRVHQIADQIIDRSDRPSPRIRHVSE